MKQSINKIVMLPTWKKELQKTGYKYLEEHKFLAALNVFNKLLEHGENNLENVLGKILCLAGLNQWQEAIKMLEHIIFTEGDKRHEYIRLYAKLLYQVQNYERLIDLVEQFPEIKDLPKPEHMQVDLVYKLSKQKIQSPDEQYIQRQIKRLINKVGTGKFLQQRQIIRELRKLKIDPTVEIIELLNTHKVHPLIKTDLLLWFRSMNLTQTLEVEKLGNHVSIKADQIREIHELTLYNDVKNRLQPIENDNPIYFSSLIEVLERFLYIWYPLPLDDHTPDDIVIALKSLYPNFPSKAYYSFPKQTEDLKEIISECDLLYLGVIYSQ